MKRLIRDYWLPSLLMLMVCFIWLGKATAAEVTLNWTNATQNTDATAIPATGVGSLESTTLKWGACNPDDTPAAPLLEQTIPTTVPGASESTIVTIGTPGRWCFVGFHTNVGDPANNIDPQVSADSNTAFRVIVTITDPPGNLTVVIAALQVYTVNKTDDKFVLLEVGTVPAGTACDPDQYVNGHHVVPAAALILLPGVEADPQLIVAKCI